MICEQSPGGGGLFLLSFNPIQMLHEVWVQVPSNPTKPNESQLECDDERKSMKIFHSQSGDVSPGEVPSPPCDAAAGYLSRGVIITLELNCISNVFLSFFLQQVFKQLSFVLSCNIVECRMYSPIHCTQSSRLINHCGLVPTINHHSRGDAADELETVCPDPAHRIPLL